MRVLAIDPGLDTGWAEVRDGELIACGLGNPEPPEPHDRLVIERPQVYRGRFAKGDPNNLITLAIQVGRYEERFAVTNEVEEILPHDWKGSVDPDVLCRRVVASLLPREYSLIVSVLEPLARKPMTDEFLTSGKRHNVIDAVGLAIWSVGPRLAARFPRSLKG